jgi:hypothetical protein
VQGPASAAPLVVTAELPPEIQALADRLRREHYPPERNQLPAHVTLFHALPPWCEDELRDALGALARAYVRPRARLEGVMPLGSGTALRLTSPGILEVRAKLAERFHGLLTAQDNHPPRLHVTIQNKVSPREAKALQAALAATLEPRDFAFAGLAMHAYRGGPWELLKRSPFRS